MILYEDRWYQTEATQSVVDYFLAGNVGNPVIALPTGTGKSVVITRFTQYAFANWPGQRFLILTHVKELIEQNAAKMASIWPQAPLGIYSAGLNQRDTVMPIVFGGSASVVNCVEKFGHRDLLIIDEAHLLSPTADTTYQKIIHQLMQVNPLLKVVGLTATPFRVGQGMITDGGIFTDICYDQTGLEAFNRMIREGYLAPLVPRRVKNQLDLSGVGRGANGDFAQNALELAVNQPKVVWNACAEMCEMAERRNSWLVFAAGNENSDHVAKILNSFGIVAAAIHSGISSKERANRIRDYKAGIIRCLVNNNVLTTGFDWPPLDFIGMLRPTMSPGLWVQMLGRGTRPSPETGKVDCLVGDFAKNTERLGPINDPKIPHKKGGGSGEAPIRICDECGTYNHASVRKCTFCGAEFEFSTKIVGSASTQELIKSDLPVIEYFDVQQVAYYQHDKKGRAPTIRISYVCNGGLHKFDEWINLEGVGFNGKKSREWWRRRFDGDYVPESNREALALMGQLRVPHKIKVWVNKDLPEILNHDFEG